MSHSHAVKNSYLFIASSGPRAVAAEAVRGKQLKYSDLSK